MLNWFAVSLGIFPDAGQGAALGSCGVWVMGEQGMALLEMPTHGEAQGWHLQQCLGHGILSVTSLAVPGPSPGVCVPLQVPAAPRTVWPLPWSSGHTTPAWCPGAARPPWSAWPMPGMGTPPALMLILSFPQKHRGCSFHFFIVINLEVEAGHLLFRATLWVVLFVLYYWIKPADFSGQVRTQAGVLSHLVLTWKGKEVLFKQQVLC